MTEWQNRFSAASSSDHAATTSGRFRRTTSKKMVEIGGWHLLEMDFYVSWVARRVAARRLPGLAWPCQAMSKAVP